MSKVPFTKLGLTKNTEVKNFTWKDQTIEVKQYLPIQDKLSLIAAVLNKSQDENNFVNDAKVNLFIDLEIINYYTNISTTEKQKEDPAKLYDLFCGTGFIKKIYDAMPEGEVEELYNLVYSTAEHFYKYRNSIYGILDALNTDYNNLNLDAESIKEKLADKESLGLLKDVLTKLD